MVFIIHLYLSVRIQSVSVHSLTFMPASVSSGVSQGSVLGPILFVLYTTPLAVVIERHSIVRGLCREPSGRPEDGRLRSRTGICDVGRRRPVAGK